MVRFFARFDYPDPARCASWAGKPTAAFSAGLARKQYVSRREPMTDLDFDKLSEALFRYEVYPPDRLRALVCTEDRRISTGCLIVQRFRLGVFILESAVRVVEVGRLPDHRYFAYETLIGHSERGIATFALARTTEEVTFTIATRSEPGSTLARIAAPIARRVQESLNAMAVARMFQLSSWNLSAEGRYGNHGGKN